MRQATFFNVFAISELIEVAGNRVVHRRTASRFYGWKPQWRSSVTTAVRRLTWLCFFSHMNGHTKMIRPIVVASLFVVTAHCTADEPAAQPVDETPIYTQLQKQIDQLERRVVELERQRDSRPQFAPRSTKLPNSQFYRTPTPPLPLPPNFTQPPQGPALPPVQPPHNNVPQNWQKFYFNGQWFYIVPIDGKNASTTSNRP